MNRKFYGVVAFVRTSETSPGVYTPSVIEKHYSGDIISDHRRNEGGQVINDSIVINNKFSIVADTFAFTHTKDICYVRYLGTKWKITNAEIAPPRLILTAGGVYNEQSEED